MLAWCRSFNDALFSMKLSISTLEMTRWIGSDATALLVNFSSHNFDLAELIGAATAVVESRATGITGMMKPLGDGPT
jgi:hypothetical protein